MISIFLECHANLSERSKKFFKLYVIAQLVLATLDLAGVTILGLVASISLNQVSNKSNSNFAEKALTYLGLRNHPLEVQISIMVLIAVLLMVSKSILAQFTIRKMLENLNHESNLISTQLLKNFFLNTNSKMEEISNQEILTRVATGAPAATVGVVGNGANILGDGLLLMFLLFGLFIVSPAVTFIAIVFFGLTSVILNKLIHSKSRSLGKEIYNLTHLSSNKIIEILSSRRELWTNGNFKFKLNQLILERVELSGKSLELNILPNVSKYVIESSLLIGAALFAGIELFLFSATHALTALSIFLAAGSRIAPALLRIQQSLIALVSNIPIAKIALVDFKDAEVFESKNLLQIESEDTEKSGKFIPRVTFEKVTFSYDDKLSIIQDLSLDILPGQFIGIFGPSGVGKSTILDLMIGLLRPSTGRIVISGESPVKAINGHPGKIAYVAQQTFITSGTILDNIAFGVDPKIQNERLAWEAIQSANLESFISEKSAGMNEFIYENGKNLSGGQRQRIGIARALYTQPELLLLDESTSSLDSESELEILNSLKLLKGKMTLVSVTHKLASISAADKILYIGKSGHFFGSFIEVVNNVREFEVEAKSLRLL